MENNEFINRGNRKTSTNGLYVLDLKMEMPINEADYANALSVSTGRVKEITDHLQPPVMPFFLEELDMENYCCILEPFKFSGMEVKKMEGSSDSIFLLSINYEVLCHIYTSNHTISKAVKDIAAHQLRACKYNDVSYTVNTKRFIDEVKEESLPEYVDLFGSHVLTMHCQFMDVLRSDENWNNLYGNEPGSTSYNMHAFPVMSNKYEGYITILSESKSDHHAVFKNGVLQYVIANPTPNFFISRKEQFLQMEPSFYTHNNNQILWERCERGQ